MKLSIYFEWRKRDTVGTDFAHLKEDRPEWLYDAVYEAHDGLICAQDAARRCIADLPAEELVQPLFLVLHVG